MVPLTPRTSRLLAAWSVMLALGAGPAPAAAEDPGAASGAPAAGDAPATCAFISRINGWTYVDRRTILVRTGARDEYRVTFATSCRNLRSAIGIVVLGRGTGCLSPGDRIRGTPHWLGDGPACLITRVEPVVPAPEPDGD